MTVIRKPKVVLPLTEYKNIGFSLISKGMKKRLYSIFKFDMLAYVKMI